MVNDHASHMEAITVSTENDDQPSDGESERRAPHRVSNDQGTGNGSATALSKMQMIERKKSEWQQYERPAGD